MMGFPGEQVYRSFHREGVRYAGVSPRKGTEAVFFVLDGLAGRELHPPIS